MIRRLKVAMVAACPFPARRGTPLRVERLAETLVAQGHSVRVIGYHIAEDPKPLQFPVERIFDRTTHRNLPPGPTTAKLFVYDPALARRARKVLARERFDVIHAHHCEGLLAAAWARRGMDIPLVFDAHTTLAGELPCYRFAIGKTLTRRLGTWIDGILPGLCDHIVAVTPDIRSYMVERSGASPEQITVVMNGVEAEHFAPCVGADGSPERSGDGRPRLIYSGNLAPYQGIELMLRAFAEVRRRRDDATLMLSVPSSLGPWSRLAGELGIAGAIDIVPDDFDSLPDRLAQADVALMPRTECDGIPQKLLNYMAAGRAIVSSAGSAKVLENDRTGLVVPNGDVPAFAGAILSLLDDPGRTARLGREARAYVDDNCSWPSAAGRLEDVYQKVLGTAVRTEDTRAARCGPAGQAARARPN